MLLMALLMQTASKRRPMAASPFIGVAKKKCCKKYKKGNACRKCPLNKK